MNASSILWAKTRIDARLKVPRGSSGSKRGSEEIDR
jgi:hypothetical protein